MNDNTQPLIDPTIKIHGKYIYTRCYCEENVYKLCEDLSVGDEEKKDKYFVVFVSNKNKKVPLWGHSAEGKDKVIVWDYHVFLIEKGESQHETKVYDHDARYLPCPCAFIDHFEECFRPEISLKEEFLHSFRILKGYEFLNSFSSDRSHMINKVKGGYLMPPPSYPPIQIQGVATNLESFLEMDESKNSVVPGVSVKVKEY
eukprot:TRINITY_DN3095_c0_g3_i1.p1 TRINITY_DN3095_c0_g3~~TRINITY_DN3095_c0_g3_i1.p1  ORF type:complete len:222 (-),score=51.73 TRINITY_DN3095_c0_g3_i1:63-665(-)